MINHTILYICHRKRLIPLVRCNISTEFFAFVYVGFCALSMCVQTHLLLGHKIELYPSYLFVFGCTVFAYNFQHPQPFFKATAIVFGSIAAFTIFWIPIHIRLQFLLFSLLGAGYFFLPNQYSLRNNTFLKPVVIALVWVFMCVTLPTDCADISTLSKRVMLIGLEKICFIGVTALCYDMIDIITDTRFSLTTIPVRFGVNLTRNVSYFLLFSSALIATYSLSLGFYTNRQWLAIVSSILIMVYLVSKLGKTKDTKKSFFDGILLLQSILVALASL